VFPGQGAFGSGFRSGGRGNRGNQTYVFAYPFFVGGGYGMGYDPGSGPPPDGGPPPPQGPPQPQNITVIYPPAQHATPMMIQPPPPDGEPGRPGATIFEAQPPPEVMAGVQQPDNGEPHYLIAFKDHIIYSAIAYWVDGDTLHYFTSGNTHNQASLSLLDRDLTERLNKELGIEFKLPPAK
jgi:hypothetical protein